MADIVDRATALRHAQTNKAAPGSGYQGDLVRTLTPAGQAQSMARRGLLGDPTFDGIGTSPLLRARETGVIVGGLEDADSLTLIDEIGVSDPATSDDAAAIDALFERLGYAPLRTYLDANEDLMLRYGTTGWRGVQTFLYHLGSNKHALVIGHAVLLPAAFYVAAQREPSMARELETLNLNEAGGFTIVWRNGELFDFLERNEKL